MRFQKYTESILRTFINSIWLFPSFTRHERPAVGTKVKWLKWPESFLDPWNDDSSKFALTVKSYFTSLLIPNKQEVKTRFGDKDNAYFIVLGLVLTTLVLIVRNFSHVNFLRTLITIYLVVVLDFEDFILSKSFYWKPSTSLTVILTLIMPCLRAISFVGFVLT